MIHQRRGAIALGVASALAGGVLVPSGSRADSANPVLEEVVVTAQRREQNLQDVGISVTAFSGAQIRDLVFLDAVDIVQQTPNVTIAQSGAGAINTFAIRGVTQSDFAGVHESPVAVYLDEAYVSQNTVTNFSIYDLERVEILRGPQGTLFGRNATGGLVNYVTVKPGQEFDGYAEALIGSEGRQHYEGAVGGGLAETVSMRVSAVMNESDGLMKNRIGKDGQSTNDWSARGQVLFEPTDTLDIWVKGQYSKDDSDRGNYFHRVGYSGQFEPPPATDFFGYRSANEMNYWAGAWDFDGYNKVSVAQGTLRADWTLDSVTLTYLGDYQDIDSEYAEDSDVSPNNIFNYSQKSLVTQWSQELRASWQTAGTNNVVGAYFLNIDGDYSANSLVFGQEDVDWMDVFYGVPEPGGYNLVSTFPQTTKTWALYGQTEIALNDQFRLTLGARWTDDDKDYSFTQSWDNVEGAYVFFEGVDGPGDITYFDYKNTYSHGDWSGVIRLDYQPNDDWLWYGSINRGIKGGGFNAPVDATGLVGVNEFGQYIPFDQNNAAMEYDGEVLWAYEVGFKSTLAEGRARFNTSIFYYDYQDNQVYNMVGLTQIVFNSPASDMWGGEIELVVTPVDALDIMLGASYLDSNVEVPVGVRPDGKTTSSAVVSPEISLNGLARYTWELGDIGSLALQADFRWLDNQIFNLSNTEVIREGSNTVVNASLSYSAGTSGVYGNLFVKNLFDEQYREGAFDTTASFGSVEGSPGLKRWYGLTIGYRW